MNPKENEAKYNAILCEFGKKLRQIRLEKGISQEALALDIGFDRTYISLLERGKRNPSLITLSRIAEYLQVSVKDFI